MERALTIFINVWVGLFALVNLIGIAGQFYLHGFGGGLSNIQEIYSPFNVINFVVAVVTLSPALGAMLWRDKIRSRRTKSGILNE